MWRETKILLIDDDSVRRRDLAVILNFLGEENLACGSGELLCRWARDHGVTGTGVDISTFFLGEGRGRAAELDVADRLTFVHADAGGHPDGLRPLSAAVPGLGCLRAEAALTGSVAAPGSGPPRFPAR